MNFIPNNNKVKVGYGYRLLGGEETIKEGDTYNFVYPPPDWCVIIESIGKRAEDWAHNFYFRRPIDVGAGYRLVGIDEKIERKDQFIIFHDTMYNSWTNSAVHTIHSPKSSQTHSDGRCDIDTNGVAYRRKVVSTPCVSDQNIFVISLDNNPSLHKIIEDILHLNFKFSCKGDYGNEFVRRYNVATGKYDISVDLVQKTYDHIFYPNMVPAVWPRYKASTQLGDIIRMLETPYVSEIKPPVIHGYDAEYTKNDSVIKFGCASIGIQLLRSAYKLLSPYVENGGNRTVSSITLNSGRTLTMEQIDQILKHVRKINGN